MRRNEYLILKNQFLATTKTSVDDNRFTNNAPFLDLDDNLRCNRRTDLLSGKLSSACYSIKLLMQQIDLTTSKMVCYAYLHSNVYYGIRSWEKSAPSLRIFKLQNRVIRALSAKSLRLHLKILNFVRCNISPS